MKTESVARYGKGQVGSNSGVNMITYTLEQMPRLRGNPLADVDVEDETIVELLSACSHFWLSLQGSDQ
jgi:hypothetical protein